MSSDTINPSPRADEHVQYGLYKYGKGYWVRVMTAVMAGVLAVAGSFWASDQLSAVPIPMPTWEVTTSATTGQLAPGARLEFVNDQVEPPMVVASATVRSVESQSAGSADFIVGEIVSAKGRDLREGRLVRAADGGAAVGARVESARGIPAFNRMILQTSVAGVLILAGVAGVYWLVGRKHQSVDFLIAVDDEMKKVNWSTKKNIRDSTIVVIMATFGIAAILFLFDGIFQFLTTRTGILR